MASKNSEIKVDYKVVNTAFNKGLKEMKGEVTTLNKEFALQKEQMKLTATESEKLEVNIEKLNSEYENAQKQTRMTETAYENVVAIMGEGSKEAETWSNKLLDAQKNEAYLENAIQEKTSALEKSNEATRKAVQEQEKLETNTKRLDTLFEATGTTLDDYIDTLGTRMVKAIRDGDASSDQLEVAINKVGRSALGAETDLQKMKRELDSLDDGGSLTNLRKDIDMVETEIEEATEEAGDFVGALEGVAGALGAVASISDVVESALDVSSLDTTVEVAFNVPEESVETVKEAIRTVEAYGIESEEAIEGVRRQWALNSDASDESNQAIIEGAGAISRAYSEIDFVELVQEVNEISSQLKMTDEEALGLVNSLIKIGFPPEEIDIIAEYGRQLSEAGYSAEEIQAIMTAGVKTDSWNIDNLLDGLGEGRKLLAEFGVEIDEATSDMLEGTSISADQLREWGRAVADGGKRGKEAFQEVAQSLLDVEDKTKQNELGVKLFGTMWEEQGTGILDTILNMDENLISTVDNQEQLNDTLAAINSDPMIQIQNAISEVRLALEPLLETVGDWIVELAEWISQNSELAATITTLVTILGIVTGVILGVAGAYALMAAGANTASMAMAPFMLSILAIVAVVTAVIAIFVYWEEITTWLKEVFASFGIDLGAIWETIKTVIINAVSIVSEYVMSVFGIVISWWNENSELIRATTATVWGAIQSIITVVLDAIGPHISAVIESWKTIFSTAWELIKGIVDIGINGVLGVVKAVMQIITGDFDGAWETIKTTASNAWNGIKETASTTWNGIKDAIVGPITAARDTIRGIVESITGLLSNIKAPSVVRTGSNKILGIEIPTFGISWNAAGGIFNQPSIIGHYGGNLQGVGEAGPEAVIPLNHSVLASIGAGISQTMNNDVVVERLEALIDIEERMLEKETYINMIMNEREVARGISTPLNNYNQTMDGRGGRMRGDW